MDKNQINFWTKQYLLEAGYSEKEESKIENIILWTVEKMIDKYKLDI